MSLLSRLSVNIFPSLCLIPCLPSLSYLPPFLSMSLAFPLSFAPSLPSVSLIPFFSASSHVIVFVSHFSFHVPVPFSPLVPVSSPCVLVCVFPVLFWQFASCVQCVQFCFLLCHYVYSPQLCSPCVSFFLVTLLHIYGVSCHSFCVRLSVLHALCFDIQVSGFLHVQLTCSVFFVFSSVSPSLVIVYLPSAFSLCCSLNN